MAALKALNLALLVLYPVAWFAPLMRAGLNLPLFGKTEISVISGLQALWRSDVALALVVSALALFAPYLKTLGLALVQFGLAAPALLPALALLGRLAMADVFLIALYVVLAKGVGYVSVEVAWGLWLFTGCILASVVLGFLTERRLAAAGGPPAPRPGGAGGDGTGEGARGGRRAEGG